MKKILIILVGVLLLPLTVYADMGAPENLTYEIEVTSSDGATLYSMKCDIDYENCKLVKLGTIPKGETFEIYYEDNINGEFYAQVTYNKETGYIKLSDITIISKEISLKDASELEEPIEKTVLSKELTVHSSPAKAFKVVGTIPKGEKIKLTYYYGDTWYYVEYKDIKGWIDCFNGAIGNYQDKDILILREKRMYDENSNTITTIPANTKIKGYYELDAWSGAYYVEYDKNEGYVDFFDIARSENNKLKLFKDTEAYKSYEDTDECAYYSPTPCQGDIVIPKDTELSQVYFYQAPRGIGSLAFYQVKYKNELYWIHEKFAYDEESTFFDYNYIAIVENKTIKVDQELKMYSSPDDFKNVTSNEASTIKPIATIKKDEEIKLIYSILGVYYVENSKGTKGWIEYYDYYYAAKEDNQNLSEPEIEEDEEEIEIEEKNLSKNELLYICIGGAIALTLTIIVIIIIINKKRKQQNQ